MIRDKKTEIIALVLIVASVAICVFFLWFASKNKSIIEKENEVDATEYISTEYVNKIFDDSYVHTINIEVSDVNWDYMILHATEEQYVLCDAIIDGKRIENVALRPKGNSSLASIQASGSERFSYKIEFDYYQTNNTYYGLDKLALNNLGQDKTLMKDYLAYHMMNDMQVAAPLSAYTLVQINGEDFGLYLAVEAIEDSFCYRNYGKSYGNLYRPDAFAIETIHPSAFTSANTTDIVTKKYKRGQRADILGQVINLAFADVQNEVSISALNYWGDDTKTYDTVFDTSVFDINKNDKERFIESVKIINQGYNRQTGEQEEVQGDLSNALDMDQVIRYFVVHNFINNYDSYNTVFVHNFYVHEKDGRLSMVPWDYNLGFGAFSLESAMYCFFGDTTYNLEVDLGDGLTADESFVNYPIDTPFVTVNQADRPMFDSWIHDLAYKDTYHKYYLEFIENGFESGYYSNEIERVSKMISPYVENDLTFYETDEYKDAVEQNELYCNLRAIAIKKQIDGTMPSTLEGQEQNPDSLLDIGDLNLGKTIDFEGLAWGITSDDITQILDAIAGKNEHTAEGVTESIAVATKDKAALKTIIKSVLSQSSLVKRLLKETARPVLYFVFSIIVLLVALKFIKKYKRR